MKESIYNQMKMALMIASMKFSKLVHDLVNMKINEFNHLKCIKTISFLKLKS